jgi:tetratricopeptide (TPR) repeat protein
MSSLHQRAKEVFLRALEKPAAERAAFVADACASDEALRQEVESLLAFHEEEAHEEATPSRPKTDPSTASFATGEVFAGRYRMITRIGRGGMGDVWRAEDLVLGTEVALKLIGSAGPSGRERILNEVRVARQITHPAVCRVFDVGEADGRIFYSMELVRGEDLAALLRRVGRLPSEKVIEIAHRLCSGLAAAHAQGVLHRDLKPANVLIDNDGQVRITDFGIAIPRSESAVHKLTGTPGYMAPEQRLLGTALSERTDVYALGLVLYELLVGRHPFDRRTGRTGPPPAPSSLVPNVDPQLERAVMQALSADPDDRFPSALALAAALPVLDTDEETGRAVAATKTRRTSWWLAGMGVAAVIGALAVASSFFVAPGASTLTERDTIVLADFENTTGDETFDGALKVALAVALEQSPFLKVFPDDQARETLRLMQRSPDERITRAIAREIARREQFKVLLAGSIASLGRNYVLAVEAVNAETGDVVAREQSEASSKEEVLSALGGVSSSLRRKLGESLASVEKFDAPLPRATTASLEALHAYSLALSDGREVPRLESIPHLKRAIELDPTFAMAHAQLSAVYVNTGQSALAPEFSRKAFELRDRVSERERFFISWRYYRDAVQDWEQALELARSWTQTYPREAFAFNALGVALLRLGQFEQSVGPFREAIRLDPKFIPSYSNLSASLLALNRYDEARGILKEAADRNLEFIGARRLSYLIAFVQGDSETMARDLESSVGVLETNAAFGWQAHASGYAGRVEAAHEQFRRGTQLALQGSFNEVAAQLSAEDAETHAIVGQCAEARSEASAGLALNRNNGTMEHASRVFALCGAPDDALALAAQLTQQFPEATLTRRVSVPVIEATVALNRRQPARALELLEPVKPYDRAPSAEFWPAYLRGLAYLQLKDGAAASEQFQSILTRRGEVPASMLFPLSHLGNARAAVLRGDEAEARKSYGEMLAMWKDADPDLTPLKEARLESSRLNGSEN